MFCYRVYGIAVQSFIHFPGLPPRPEAPQAIISQGEFVFPGSSDGLNILETADLETYLRFPGVGVFRIVQGREIIVNAEKDADINALRLCLLGACFTVLLRQRGRLVLHASAVAVDDHAVLFLGASGSGKSTLATALHQRGHQILADDLVAVDPSLPQPLIDTGFPYLKLWPESVSALGYDPNQLPVIRASSQKRFLSVGDFSPRVYPLGLIFILSKRDELKITSLSSHEAHLALLTHLREPHVNLKTSIADFRRCAELSGQVPIRQLTRSSRMDEMDELVRAVESELQLHPPRLSPLFPQV